MYFLTQPCQVLSDLLESCSNEKAQSPEHCDFLWADVHFLFENFDQLKQRNMRINHFPNHYELTKKDLLVKNITRASRYLAKKDISEAKKFGFIPSTFVLPQEKNLFIDYASTRDKDAMWILKPVRAHC